MKKNPLTILGIETSCDETAASVLQVTNNQLLITSNIVSSQVKIHAKYGGIVPEVAARKHAENIIIVLQQALSTLNQRKSASRSAFDLRSVDAIAVTKGPGLVTSLLVGVEAAKVLAFLSKKPLIPVNHLIGHIYANWLSPICSNSKSEVLNSKHLFPAICLIVSGGHTELVLMKNFENFKKIGQTLDDAAGECFDKAAKILGLGYPGGPAVAAEAAKLQITNYKLPITLPRPMINSNDFNFSFSGLKTAILYKVQKMSSQEIKNNLPEICSEVQQSIIDVLIAKTIKAAQKCNVKSIILGGGVVANEELRKQFKLKIENCKLKIDLLIPSKVLCTDNAVMIAIAGYFKLRETSKKDWQKKFDWRKIKVDPNLEI